MDIKICGISTMEATEAVIAAGATHIGFIFFAKSPRHITPERAGELSAKAQKNGLKTVAVTVNADNDYLDEIVTDMKPDILQLHGSETLQRIEEIKQRYNLPIIKAFGVSGENDMAKIDIYKDSVQRLLLDAKPPKGSDLPGGNGVSFDWSLLEGLDPSIDYMLSGGLNADNVITAIEIANPPGIDISSGVESEPGEKDTKLIAAFFDALKTVKAVEQ